MVESDDLKLNENQSDTNRKSNSLQDGLNFETFRSLHRNVLNNDVINLVSANDIVDALRQIAELIIWSDANDKESIFEYFCEENMLDYMTSVLSRSTSRAVRIQLVQTISMLIHNVQNERTLYYILSNNYINTLISIPDMYGGGDVSSWTVSLLKTLSGLLNPITIKFFFQEKNEKFPLLDQSAKFLTSGDSMKRTHVMTILLNILRVNDPSVTRYVINRSRVLIQLPLFLRQCWCRLNNCIKNGSLLTIGKNEENLIVECDDVLCFIQELMDLEIEDINRHLLVRLFNICFIPLLKHVLKTNIDITILDNINLPNNLNANYYRNVYQRLCRELGLVDKYANNKSELFSNELMIINKEKIYIDGKFHQFNDILVKNGVSDSGDNGVQNLTPRSDDSLVIYSSTFLPNVSYFIIIISIMSCKRNDIKNLLLLLLLCPIIPRNILEIIQNNDSISVPNSPRANNIINNKLSRYDDDLLYNKLNIWSKYIFSNGIINNYTSNNDNTNESPKPEVIPLGVPLEVQSNSLSTRHGASPPEVGLADSSSHYLSLKSRATPGDRGGYVGDDVTSSGEPVADLWEAEGEVNKEADGRTGAQLESHLKDKERTSSGEGSTAVEDELDKTSTESVKDIDMTYSKDIISGLETADKSTVEIYTVSSATSTYNTNLPYDITINNTIHDVTISVPLEVQSDSLPLAESSSNYLSVNGDATPGDRGYVNPEELEISTPKNVNIQPGRTGSNPEERECTKDVTSDGLPESDLRELEGEVKGRADGRNVTSGGELSARRSDVGDMDMVVDDDILEELNRGDYVCNIMMGEFIKYGLLSLPNNDNGLMMLLMLLYKLQDDYILYECNDIGDDVDDEYILSMELMKFILMPCCDIGLQLYLQIWNIISRNIMLINLRVPLIRLAVYNTIKYINYLRYNNNTLLYTFIDELMFHIDTSLELLRNYILNNINNNNNTYFTIFFDEWIKFKRFINNNYYLNYIQSLYNYIYDQNNIDNNNSNLFSNWLFNKDKHKKIDTQINNYTWLLPKNNNDTFRRYTQVLLLIRDLYNSMDEKELVMNSDYIYDYCPLLYNNTLSLRTIDGKPLNLGVELNLDNFKSYYCTMNNNGDKKKRIYITHDIFFILLKYNEQNIPPKYGEITCIHPLWNATMKNNNPKTYTITVSIIWHNEWKNINKHQKFTDTLLVPAVTDFELIFESNDDMMCVMSSHMEMKNSLEESCITSLKQYFYDK